MIKFRRLLCAVLVCALVGVAYGAALKIRSFTIYSPENPDADAMAIMNIADSQGTVIQVIVNGFTPNTTYAVGVLPALADVPAGMDRCDWTLAYTAFAPLTTDKHGNGTWHTDFGTLFPFGNIGIYVLPDGADYLELRACGNP